MHFQDKNSGRIRVNRSIFFSAVPACMVYNGETRRLFVGLDNGTISVSPTNTIMSTGCTTRHIRSFCLNVISSKDHFISLEISSCGHPPYAFDLKKSLRFSYLVINMSHQKEGKQYEHIKQFVKASMTENTLM